MKNEILTMLDTMVNQQVAAKLRALADELDGKKTIPENNGAHGVAQRKKSPPAKDAEERRLRLRFGACNTYNRKNNKPEITFEQYCETHQRK